VSAQIKQLERELGAALFDRSGRGAGLTQAGAAALRHARSVLASVEGVRRAVDEGTGVVRGRLVVGMVTACTVTPLFDALAAFHRCHPGVEIALVEDSSDRLLERLRTGGADLVLAGARERPPEGWEFLTVVSEGLVAAVPGGHPVAERPYTTLAELAAHPLVCLPEGTGVRAAFDNACVRQGVRCRVDFQASAPTAVADLAVRGLGVAILTESMAKANRHTPPLTWRPIKDATDAALLCLVWSSAAGPALEQLVVHCRRTFAAEPVSLPAPPL
jgi:DNA-binding transcriptional LysR family regulator